MIVGESGYELFHRLLVVTGSRILLPHTYIYLLQPLNSMAAAKSALWRHWPVYIGWQWRNFTIVCCRRCCYVPSVRPWRHQCLAVVCKEGIVHWSMTLKKFLHLRFFFWPWQRFALSERCPFLFCESLPSVAYVKFQHFGCDFWIWICYFFT